MVHRPGHDSAECIRDAIFPIFQCRMGGKVPLITYIPFVGDYVLPPHVRYPELGLCSGIRGCETS